MSSEHWEQFPVGDELPDRLVLDAWQESDDDHPPGTGTPCYRVVFKTLRVAMPRATLAWPNLRMRFGVGPVATGGVRAEGALAAREPGLQVLPEFAHWREVDEAIEYEVVGRVDPQLRGWTDQTPSLFYVELLIDVDTTDLRQMVPEGRRRVASLTTIVDLSLGQRVLGARLTEEAGERFGDGHFNRRVGTQAFCWEPQLSVVGLSHEQVQLWSDEVLGRFMERADSERLRFSLASRWYQSARLETSTTLAYLQYWFCTEVLALPEGGNIRPLKKLLSTVSGAGRDEWNDLVGRMSDLRARVVHGDTDQVTAAQLAVVRLLSELVLAHSLELDLTARLGQLRAARSLWASPP